MTSTSNYITIRLDNPDGVNDGHLWFGFEATNPAHELTLDCPAKDQTLCLDCPEIIVDDSSKAPETATSTYTTATTVTYTCNTGFERTTGDEQITCGTNGTWIGTAPTCTIKTCAPVSVANSAVTPVKSTYNYDDSVTYTCNVGYGNTGGPLSRTCTDTNTWSGSVPVCTIKTCAPVSVANSAVTPVKSTYNYDDSVTYTCNVGYGNTGGPLSRTCTDTNTWSGSVPVCTIKTCAPVSVANSAVTPVKSTYNYDDSVTYTCNVGYENTGGPLSRTCTDTNTWSGSVPVCTTNCPGLSHPPNGQVSPTIDVSTGQTATYTCSNGYILDGSRTRTCQGDGSWSGSEPTCTTRGGCPTGAIVAIVTAAVVVIVSVIVVVVCKHDNRYKRIWKQIKDKLNSSKRYEDPEKPQQTKETIVSEQKLNDASVTELDNVKNQHIEQTLVVKDTGVQVKSKSVMVEPENPNKLEAPSSSSNFRGAQLLHFNLNGIRSPDPATPALYPDLSSLSLFSDVYPVPDDLPQVLTNTPQVLSNTTLSSGIQQASSEFSSTASESIPVSTDVSPVPSSLPIASNELPVQSRALTPVSCH